MRLEPRESLVIERRFSRDDATDLWVSDIYFQECDNLFEVMTSNAPILLIAPGELCTVLRYSPDRVPRCPTSPSPEIPEFMQGAVLSILPALEGFMNASPDSTT